MFSRYIVVCGQKILVEIVGKEEISSRSGITTFKLWAKGHVRMFEPHEHIEGATGPETVFFDRVACHNQRANLRVLAAEHQPPRQVFKEAA